MTLQGGGVLNHHRQPTPTPAPPRVNASTLVVNGSLASDGHAWARRHAGRQRHDQRPGRPTAASLAPGNSIGTLNISGSFTPGGGGTYVRSRSMRRARATASTPRGTAHDQRRHGAGAGRSPAATAPARPTPSSMPPAACTGTYAGVSSNFAFLTPSLVLRRQQRVPDPGAAAADAFTPSFWRQHAQPEGGRRRRSTRAFANATGDFATVIGALAGLSTSRARWRSNAISGQPYADFGTMNVTNNSAMFMNAIGQQMADGARRRAARHAPWRWRRPARSRPATARAR